MNTKLTTQPYKGTKDYYPEDLFKREYLFNIWKETALSFGYEEYDTPLLEEANLYKVKSGEELANTQLYNFVDKGGREVAIRPEMTPSLARIVAAKSAQLPKPIRWFNIGRFYRYEKPQKGRTREFFQLNIDILGVDGMSAELEIFQFINTVMEKLKAPGNSWKLYMNNRYLMDYLFKDILKVDSSLIPKLSRAIDNYTKLSESEFKKYLKDIGLDSLQINSVLSFMQMDEKGLEQYKVNKGAKQLIDLLTRSKDLGINNVEFKPYIMRGIDYYTGTVIELFDTSDQNPRALFGGGRYDDLLTIFGKEKIPAFGLGWGSVTMLDYMETYNLFPPYKPSAQIYALLPTDEKLDNVSRVVGSLRKVGINVQQQLIPTDMRKQLAYASKKGFKWVLIVEKGDMILKNMETGEQESLDIEGILSKM